MDAMCLFKQFESNALKAYQGVTCCDQKGFNYFQARAQLVRKQARRMLSRRDYAIFLACADRTEDALKKCTALGLNNLRKRLSEFRIGEVLSMLLEERSRKRRQELEESYLYLRAA